MADKKTFTIEIDGLKEAYKNVVKLRDAIKELNDIELNTDSDITFISNTIEQNLSGLARANVSVQQSYTELSTTINENTEAKEQNSKKDEAKIGSIARLQETIKRLQEEYENLTEAERNASTGVELAMSIRQLEKELESVNKQMDTHLGYLDILSDAFDFIGDKIASAGSTMSTLSDTFTSATSILNTFGLESNKLNEYITNLTEVTKTLNDLQTLHSSLLSKDSLVVKLATQAKLAYTNAVKGSSIALKGFKLALASTGIGAIIVLVGTLVTNFDDVKKTVGDAVGGFERFDKILTEVEPIIAGVGNALISLLLAPVKQIINAVEGVIKVFNIFKEKGISGFGEALTVVGDTAEKSAQIAIDSYNVIGNYNKGFNDKIASQNKKAALANLQNDAKLKDEFIKNSEAKYGANWKFTEEGNKAYQSYFETLAELYKEDKEQYAQLMRDKDTFERQFKEHNAPKKVGTEPKKDLAQEAREYEELLDNIKNQTQDYHNEAIEQELKFKRKQIEIASNTEISEARKLEIEKLREDLAKKLAAQKKASDEEIKGIKDKKEALAKAAEAEAALRQAKLEGEKQIAQVEIDIINKVINTRKQAIIDLEEVHKTELKLLDEKNSKELAAIDTKYEKDKTKFKGQTDRLKAIYEAYQQQKTAIAIKHAAIRAALEKAQEAETEQATNKVDESQTNKLFKELDTDNKLLEAKQKVTEQLDKDKVKRNKLGLIDVGATKENYREAVEADKEYLKELEKNHEEKLKILDENIAAAEDDPETQKKLIAERLDLLKKYEKERAAILERIKTNEKNEADSQLAFYEDLHQKTKEKWDKINTVMTTVGTALTSALKGQLEELKAKQEEVTKQYEEAVEKHKQSQEKLKALEEEAKTATGGRAMVVQEQIARQMEANNELAKQEKDLAKQKEKLEKDAAKKEKQMKKVELAQNLVTGIANVALGITEALKKGPILGPIMAAMIGAMGAIQTATIAKQIAKLEDGGLLKGKRHAQGGMRIEGTNIEVEGDEYVVNRISTNKNLGLINYINQNRKELTASDINSYFARSGQNKDQRNLNISGRRMYEQGGILTNLETVNSVNAPENDKILEALSQINFKPVVSVVDITSAQDKLSEVKDIAGA